MVEINFSMMMPATIAWRASALDMRYIAVLLVARVEKQMSLALKVRALLVAFTALAACLSSAGRASAEDFFYGISTAFRPIGSDPNITWTQGFEGFINSIDTGGAPNVLVDLSDKYGVSLFDLPAILSVQGYFKGYAAPGPHIYLRLSLIYASNDPLIVQGNSFSAGAHLIDTDFQFFLAENGEGHFGLSCCSMSSDVLVPGGAYLVGGDYKINPTFDTFLVHYLSGDYPFTLAGSGQLSGDLTSGAIPEPSTWALLLGGFGFAGVVLRRRLQTRTAFAQAAPKPSQSH